MESIRRNTCNDLLERMASGAWSNTGDSNLWSLRVSAADTMRRFNSDCSLNDDARTDLLRSLFGSFGKGSYVSAGAQVDYGRNIFIGRNCFFNYNCTFLDGARISFGDNVWVGPGCTFATPIHPLCAEERVVLSSSNGSSICWERSVSITIEDNVWIASNVTINPGVTIGEGAVIGSGSVVTKDIAPGVLAFGNPCRAVRLITDADSVSDLLQEALCK